jgi:hypothetical protein
MGGENLRSSDPRGLLVIVPTGAEGEDKLTDALPAMGYPHWLIIAGAFLVVFGLLGLAFRQRLAPVEPTEVANRSEQGQSELEPEIVQVNRKARLAEQTKDRWTNEAKPAPWAQERGSRDKPSRPEG